MHKAEWIGHSMGLELTLAGLLVKFANHYISRGALQTITLLEEPDV